MQLPRYWYVLYWLSQLLFENFILHVLYVYVFEIFVHVYIVSILMFLILSSSISRCITFIQLLYIEMSTFLLFDSFTPHQLCTEVSCSVLLQLDSLMMAPVRPKRVEIFSVI
jgi:hypothetical protein